MKYHKFKFNKRYSLHWFHEILWMTKPAILEAISYDQWSKKVFEIMPFDAYAKGCADYWLYKHKYYDVLYGGKILMVCSIHIFKLNN